MKKGFTLIELLVVIVIIGAIATLVLPGLLNNYTKALAKIMHTQENLINDAASLAVKDYCNSPITPQYRSECKYKASATGSRKGLIKETNGEYYICEYDLETYGYYENQLTYEKTICNAFTKFELNSNNQFVNPKTYVFCGQDYDYDYITDENISEYDYEC